MKTQKAYTLIETLFAMAIIAILVGTIITNAMAATNKTTEVNQDKINTLLIDANQAIIDTDTSLAKNAEFTTGTTISKDNNKIIVSENCEDGDFGYTITVQTNTDQEIHEVAFYDYCNHNSLNQAEIFSI